MEAIWKERMDVRMMDLDAQGNWKYSAFAAGVEAAAEHHDAYNGAGNIWMREQHQLAWVLINSHLEMRGTPRLHENLKITTWCRGAQGILVWREVLFFGEDDREIARSAASCALVRLPKMRPIPPKLWPVDYPYLPEKTMFGPYDKEKLPAVAQDAPVVMTRTARYCDLDLNNHVNNARYLDWITDAWQAAGGETIRAVDMQYISQVLVDQPVDMRVQRLEGCAIVQGDCGGKSMFRARLHC
nr:acyl-ACP thioesterase domain-containing protein [Maliibacterium massiliense]